MSGKYKADNSENFEFGSEYYLKSPVCDIIFRFYSVINTKLATQLIKTHYSMQIINKCTQFMKTIRNQKHKTNI